MRAIERVRLFVLAAIAGSALAPGMAPDCLAAEPQPLPALIKVRYAAGRGEEFRVQDGAGIRAVMAWLAKAEDGRMSEHESIGLCVRDGEMEFYRNAEDRLPSRTISLFIRCGHVSGRVVTAEQFAELRGLLAAAGKRGGAASELKVELSVEQLSNADAEARDAALAEAVRLGRLAQSPPADRGPLVLAAFADAVWRMPTPDQPTPLVVGVRVANAGKDAQEFWPAELQPILRWGDGAAAAVGESSNRSARPQPVTLGPGESQLFLIRGARLAYIGTPKYLAFFGNAFWSGAVYELALKGAPREVGLAFRYTHAGHGGLRTDEVKCRVEEQGR